MKNLILGVSLLAISLGALLVATEPQSLSTERSVVVLLGAPGCGKGTQAQRLAKELKIPHISTGDLFRENISQNTALGKQAKSYTEAGQLVPDALVLDMLSDRISRPDCARGFLLDGFPRTIPQAAALDKLLTTQDKFYAINLSVSDDVVKKRIEGRRNESAIERPDDNANVVDERLKVYHAQTAPLIDYYGQKNRLHTINGEQTPDAVFQDLVQIFRGAKVEAQG